MISWLAKVMCHNTYSYSLWVLQTMQSAYCSDALPFSWKLFGNCSVIESLNFECNTDTHSLGMIQALLAENIRTKNPKCLLILPKCLQPEGCENTVYPKSLRDSTRWNCRLFCTGRIVSLVVDLGLWQLACKNRRQPCMRDSMQC